MLTISRTLICFVLVGVELFASGCKRKAAGGEGAMDAPGLGAFGTQPSNDVAAVQCEGAERQKVHATLASIQQHGFDCGMRYTMDTSSLMACMKGAIAEVNQRRAQMSEACQALFDTSAQQQGRTPPPGARRPVGLPPMPAAEQPLPSTMCHGSVCCDNTGCYGG